MPHGRAAGLELRREQDAIGHRVPEGHRVALAPHGLLVVHAAIRKNLLARRMAHHQIVPNHHLNLSNTRILSRYAVDRADIIIVKECNKLAACLR